MLMHHVAMFEMHALRSLALPLRILTSSYMFPELDGLNAHKRAMRQKTE